MVKIPMVCRQHVPTGKKYITLHTVLPNYLHTTYVHTTTYLHKLLNYTYLLQVIQDYRGQDLNTIITYTYITVVTSDAG